MIARAIQENLRLVFEPAKCARVNDASAVALKLGPISMTRFGIFSAARITRFLRKRRQRGELGRFHLLARLPTIARNTCRGRRFLAHATIIRRLSILASPESRFAEAGIAKFVPLFVRPFAPSAYRRPPATARSTPARRRSARTR